MAIATVEGASGSRDSSFQPIEPTTPIVLVAHPKTFQITTVESLEGLIKVNKTLKEWNEALSDRFANARTNKESDPDKYNQDRAVFDDCLKVKGFLGLASTKKKLQIESSKTPDEPVVIALSTDQDGIIQAMASSTIRTEEVYLNALLTAPWNLRMNSLLPEDHQRLCAKGAGTGLMAHSYQLAQTNQKRTLSLSPLDNSVGFYKKIGMQERGNQLVYDVTAETPLPLSGALPQAETIEEEKQPF